MRTILLIDADVFRYQFAYSNTKTIDWEDGSDTVSVINKEKAIDDLDVEIEGLLKQFKALDFHLPISDSKGNFRKKVLKSYKANRADKEKPELWHVIDEALRTKYGHKLMHLPKLEGDDVLGLLSTEPDTQERRIIVSIDKDMKTIPGWLYNPKKPELGLQQVTETDANRYWMYQTLIGDTTDGYSGCPKIGPVKAEVILNTAVEALEQSGTATAKDYLKAWWEAVVDTFVSKGLTPKDALIQARCARILRHGDFNPLTGKIKLWVPPSKKSSTLLASQARLVAAKTPSQTSLFPGSASSS